MINFFLPYPILLYFAGSCVFPLGTFYKYVTLKVTSDVNIKTFLKTTKMKLRLFLAF